jgi:hypothetical protein
MTNAEQKELPAGVTLRDGEGTATRRFTTHSDERGLAGAGDLMRGKRA